VKYTKEHLDVRGGGQVSKAQRVLNFIKKHRDQAFFSAEIAEALKKHGVKVRDVMSNVKSLCWSIQTKKWKIGVINKTTK